jgi:hypothetical protein
MARRVNGYRRFQALLPDDPLLVGEVIAHNADGSSTIEMPGGGIMRVQGQQVAVGDNAFVQGGVVIDEAPDLPFVEVVV